MAHWRTMKWIATLLALGTGSTVTLIIWVSTREWQSPANDRAVCVLLHGMTWSEDQAAAAVWGSRISRDRDDARWDGMVGCLQDKGLRFGGIIRARADSLNLQTRLDIDGAVASAETADFFCLEFSRSAKVDGLAYKTEELACCLEELHKVTGCKKVRLVGHSAGGLIARMYLQSQLRKVKYAGDVDRLITISTPHLGAELASRLADLVTVPARTLGPESETIRRMNRSELPADVLYAAIVVRGIGTGVKGEGNVYLDLADQGYLAGLPVDYQVGGDQVVHVRSQNLRLAACARRYEETTRKPVHHILVRVPDPNPFLPFEATVHGTAPGNPEVQSWVARLLLDDGKFWDGTAGDEREGWIEQQARQCAFSAIEQEAIKLHGASRVTNVEVAALDPVGREGETRSYRVGGKAVSRDVLSRKAKPAIETLAKWLGRKGQDIERSEALWEYGVYHRTQAAGTLDLTTDCFGRIVGCRVRMTRVSDTASATPP